ncbi:MAG: M35 family metallopeptidase [Asticcacaulis sp.]|uniref:hypothetical protein n=1 Tax=Asticcacaulis sp. TaxID=1872648 RepID=UPI0025C2FFCC|nr:hypothetical protein [Asticcacaulis sp.]MCA1934258.1 M35 family metallopeptidase [Asticcacaulis sp.]
MITKSVFLFHDRYDVTTLVHEPPHLFGANANMREYYQLDALSMAKQPGGTKRALNNADSYLILVQRLGGL